MDLESRIKKSIAAATPPAPDLNPRLRKKEIEVEVLPDLQEVATSSATRMKILRLVSQSIEYQKAEAEARKLREPITREIKRLIDTECTSGKFMVDGNRVVTYEQTRKSLSKEKLLEHGVSADIINDCTDISISVALKISGPGEDGD